MKLILVFILLIFALPFLVDSNTSSETTTATANSPASTSHPNLKRVGLDVGDVLSIVELPARLCPDTDCVTDAELTRVPVGTKLKITGKKIDRMPIGDVVWYQVSYRGVTGWVSEYTTDAAPEEFRYAPGWKPRH